MRLFTMPCVAALGVSLALLGCGGGGAGVTVTGKVILGDKPLTIGSVIFRPDAAKGNQSKHEPTGRLDARGEYRLSTPGQDAVARGWYKIAVIAEQPVDPKNPYASPKPLIPPRYFNPDTSGLSVQVVLEPAPGAYDLRLQP